ncbi:glycoside hydrolase family 3 N-terminal domain-containing protein [Streptomyces longisporus]|uniref:Uncharacterized protein n=1 Tax=Streptomyces longisporus TaxID=1948 RepID=A0ABN3NHG8_STRLO
MTTAATGPEPPVTDLPFRDPALPLARRIDDLLARLTLDERIGLLYQYSPGAPRLGLAPFKTGTEGLHGVSWRGPATVFPQAIGLGATWDEELLREVATAVGTEVRAFHQRPAVDGHRHSLQVWAPVVNLLRDPRWGRNEEGYAEDAVLTGRLSVSFCRGLAGDHPIYLRTAPLLKHFLAYNYENERDVTSSVVPPRVLHEYDLAAFRPAIASGAATGVMPAYNLVNGRPCHVSPLIETEVRRWAEPTGHELFVCSDATAVTNLAESQACFATGDTTKGLVIPTRFNGDVLAEMEAKYADGSGAGPASWTTYQEYGSSFVPDAAGNTITMTPDFLKAINDGVPVTLTFSYWSGAKTTYTVTKSGTTVTGSTA